MCIQYNSGQHRRKTRKIENLERQMKTTSNVKPGVTSHIEKKTLYSETVSGNQQKKAEQKPTNVLLRVKVATAYEEPG